MLCLFLILVAQLVTTFCQIVTEVDVQINVGSRGTPQRSDVGAEMDLSFQRAFLWGSHMDPNIVIHKDLSILEALEAKPLTVTFKRTSVREECQLQRCPVCGGTGVHHARSNAATEEDGYDIDIHSTGLEGSKGSANKGNNGAFNIEVEVTLPCPHCLGSGLYSPVCTGSVYEEREANATFDIPQVNMRPGSVHAMPLLGHEVFREKKIVQGDLQLVIGSIRTADFIVDTQGNVELKIMLSSQEALYGFTYSTLVPYLIRSNEVPKATATAASGSRHEKRNDGDGDFLRLDLNRDKKTTLPGTSIKMQGKGLEPHGALILRFLLEDPLQEPVKPSFSLNEEVSVSELATGVRHDEGQEEEPARKRTYEEVATEVQYWRDYSKWTSDQFARRLLGLLSSQQQQTP